MRLLQLQLLRFGHFTDLDLDFAPAGASLHVIFGSNEAGKSTTLRAVSGLLFGIPETTRDAHRHDMRELRIGARLEKDDGQCLQVIRRKGRKNTLLAPDGSPLQETVLEPFLAGVNRELFATMFGLSHTGLVEGGKELLDGRGELGESLFGAGIGVGGIHGVRTALLKETSDIFAPRAQNPPLNRAFKALDEAKKEGKRLSLKPQTFHDVAEKLRQAQAQSEQLDQEHGAALAELTRLKRLKRVLPQIQKRDQRLQQLQPFDPTRLVPESCAEERKQAQSKISTVELRESKLVDERQRCEKARAALPIPEQLLAQETAIKNLQDPLGAHKKALADLPGLKAEVASDQEDAVNILRELGRQESLQELKNIDVALQARIRALGQQGARLETELRKAQRDVAAIEKTLEELETRRDALSPPLETSVLEQSLTEARRQGDLEDQARSLGAEIAEGEASARDQLAALSLWQGPLDQVAALSLPTAATVERFRNDFEKLADERRLAQSRRQDVLEQLDAIRNRIADLETRGTVPTEAELHRVRTQRDQQWQRICAAWLDGAGGDGSPQLLATTYQQRVTEADAVADNLWRDAERAAQHAALNTDKRRRQAECQQLDAQLDNLAQRQTALLRDWQALWTPLAIDPLPPAEMRSWLGRHEKLKESVALWRERQGRHRALTAEIEKHRQRCHQALAALRKTVAEDSLTVILHRAEAELGALKAAANDHRQLLRELDNATRQRQTLRETLAQAEQDLTGWQAKWQRAVQPLNLASDASIEEANAVLDGFARLFQKLDKARSYQRRIDDINRDAGEFSDHVRALARACDLTPENAATADLGDALVNQLQRAKENAKDRNNLDQRLQQIRAELDELQRDREHAEAILNRLRADAGVSTLDALEDREESAKAYRELSAEVKNLETQLSFEDIPLEELVAQARAVDPDALPGQIQALEEKHKAIEQERGQRSEELGQLKSQLKAMDGGRAAADAAAAAQQALAEIKTHVETYARLKLSALLLSREIETYRQRNQGPIVKRAGELFRHMALNAYSGLSTGFADDDKLVLLCVRDNGQQVAVDGLSEGTRDQLYLALRLASLERHAEHSEPLPLVVDDILINFDDRRAKATLALLGELAEKTQVLFFTHHRRLLELAREAVPARRLRVHDLDALAR